MEVWVAGIGVLGPGLEGWASASMVLKGEKPYAPGPVQPGPPEILDARERRRASPKSVTPPRPGPGIAGDAFVWQK